MGKRRITALKEDMNEETQRVHGRRDSWERINGVVCRSGQTFAGHGYLYDFVVDRGVNFSVLLPYPAINSLHWESWLLL